MNLRPVFDALRYPSTKRGFVMFVTGIAVLYNTWFGSANVDVLGIEQYVTHIVERVMSWLGVGLTVVGMLGWLPDDPSPKRGPPGFNDASPPPPPPPIELQGRPEAPAGLVPYRDVDDDYGAQRMQYPLPAERQPDAVEPVTKPGAPSHPDGWNG